jgi:hypothetical protein
MAALATDRSLAADEELQPFRPIENSSLRVVSDPGAFATLNRKFTWVLEWRSTQAVLPGTQIEVRCLNLRTYYARKYCGIEVDRADVIFPPTHHPRSPGGLS